MKDKLKEVFPFGEFLDVFAVIKFVLSDTSNIEPNWTEEELEDSFVIKIPMVGVSQEDIKIKVKDGWLYINNEENVFTPNVCTEYLLPVEANSKTIEVVLRDGILSIFIDKPDNYEFDLIVGE